MQIFVDLDGILCTNTNGDYASAEPIQSAIDRLAQLYKEGHHITIWTARGATTGLDWRQLTERQLGEWGVMHHELRMDKPHYDLFFDDRALSVL